MAELYKQWDDTGTDHYIRGGRATSSGDGYVDYDNLQHVVLPYITQTVDNGDTFVVTGDERIVTAAFESLDGDGMSAAVISATQLGFVGGSDVAGYLHLWLANDR